MANKILPAATQIVDYYHAREHVHDLAKQLAPVLGEHQPDWLADRITDLDKGDIERLVHATQALPLTDADRDQTDTALDYFIRNAVRTRYDVFRDKGMFIGSGVVEAGCKTVVGQRLKQSGMRWNIPAATGILTLRCHRGSNRWEEIWPQPTTRPHPPRAGTSPSSTPPPPPERAEPRSRPVTYKSDAHTPRPRSSRVCQGYRLPSEVGIRGDGGGALMLRAGTRSSEADPDIVLRGLDQAEQHVSGICFKTGPPGLLGIELEWTVHHINDPTRPLNTALLA